LHRSQSVCDPLVDLGARCPRVDEVLPQCLSNRPRWKEPVVLRDESDSPEVMLAVCIPSERREVDPENFQITAVRTP
jgi:hypothetical protein